jgi:SOS-response transcriptional repressor LexA
VLTARQKQLMDFITAYQKHHDGISPRFSEMMAACDVKSKSGVTRLLDCLRDRGFITRMPKRHQAITVLDRSRTVYFVWSPVVQGLVPRAA